MKSYERHIAHTHAWLKDHTWCGERIGFNWAYLNIDHAAYSAPKDAIQPCRKCLKAAIESLRGRYDSRPADKLEEERLAVQKFREEAGK